MRTPHPGRRPAKSDKISRNGQTIPSSGGLTFAQGRVIIGNRKSAYIITKADKQVGEQIWVDTLNVTTAVGQESSRYRIMLRCLLIGETVL